MFIPYKDASVFPFGKHKGVLFKDVPSEYLKWIWENFEHHEKNEPILDYIRRCRKAIEQDVGKLDDEKNNSRGSDEG